MASKIDLLSDVNSTKFKWNLKVLIVRLCKVLNQEKPNETYRAAMVVQDEKGECINASIRPALLDKFMPLLHEGGLYLMSNFSIGFNNTSIKTNQHKFKLNFMQTTSVKKIEDPEFPNNMFLIKPLSEVLNSKNFDENILFDFMGEVVKRGHPQMRDVRGIPTKFIKLQLEDAEKNKLPLTLWGNFVDEISTHLNNAGAEPMILVLQFFRARKYMGDLGIENYFDVSNMLANPSCKEVVEFRNKLLAGSDHSGQRISEMSSETNSSHGAAIVNATYPKFHHNEVESKYLQQRAILAPTSEMVEAINNYMVSLNNNSGESYLSLDTACKSDSHVDFLQHLHTPKFLNGIKCSGVPNHELNLKVGVPVMLLRSIDQSSGLCNRTRLVITRLGRKVLEAKIISGNNAGEKVFIPRMTLTPSDPRLPFKFQRRQYPLAISFAMSINKSQGQSLSHVGLFLKKPVFTHGQLYVAFSRVTNREGLKVLIYSKDETISSEISNVVYKEVFRNLS